MILIVEDDELNIQLFELLLGNRGLAVRSVRSAQEARASLEVEMPELILLDIQMPDVNGLEFATELRTKPATSHLPVVAVTAFAMREYAERARAAGCDGFIPKPVDPRKFGEQVEAFMRQFSRNERSRSGERV
jgi:two-component system, cell cycle response regulator DivK